MMRKTKAAACVAVSAIAACFCLMPVSVAAQSTENAQAKPVLSPFSYFSGDWECAGKFDSSGKTIEARQHFATDLDGSWMTFRHEDKPPFGYRALAEWGWDGTRKEFVMLAEDSSGGARIFHSSGWNLTQLQWDGDALGSSSAPAQRFTFERLDDRHFKVSYFVLKGGEWSRVDSSTCSKQ